MESKGRPGMGNVREESALNMFRQMDLKGKTKDDTQLKTIHQNTISTIRVYDDGDGGMVKKFSSESGTTVVKQLEWNTDDIQRVVLMVESPSGLPDRDRYSYGPHTAFRELDLILATESYLISSSVAAILSLLSLQ